MARHRTAYVALVALRRRTAVVIETTRRLAFLLLHRGVVMTVRLLSLPPSNQFLFTETGADLAFLSSHCCVVKLHQVRKHLDDVLAVVRVLANGVVPEPEHFEREILQVSDVRQVFNCVLAQVKFCQLAAVLERRQCLDLVERETADLQIG